MFMRAAAVLALCFSVGGARAAELGGDVYKGAVVSIIVHYRARYVRQRRQCRFRPCLWA
jgi:hypothetical protein